MKKNFSTKLLFLFLVIVLALSVIAPIATGIIYHLLFTSRRVFTADGILAYFGAFISSFVAIVIAFISLLQSNKEMERQDEKEKENRLKDILPCLNVSVQKEGEDTFCITICNYSNSPAFNLHLFEYPLFPIVSHKKERTRKFRLDSKQSVDLCIESSYFEINRHGLPTSLQLLYNDKDGNLISQDFVWHHDTVYEKDPEEYIVRRDIENG